MRHVTSQHKGICYHVGRATATSLVNDYIRDYAVISQVCLRVYYVQDFVFAIFVPGPTTPGIEAITKLDVAHQAPQYLQTLLAFVPKASQITA